MTPTDQASTAETIVVDMEPDDELLKAWGSLADDYAAGAICGYTDRIAGSEPDITTEAPDNDPWRSAWQRGYLDGWIVGGYAEPKPGLTTPTPAPDEAGGGTEGE